MTFFSHRPFSCFNVPFFLRGSQNAYISPISQYILSLFFLPPRGPNSIANFDVGGHGRICPLDPPLHAYIYAYELGCIDTCAYAYIKQLVMFVIVIMDAFCGLLHRKHLPAAVTILLDNIGTTYRQQMLNIPTGQAELAVVLVCLRSISIPRYPSPLPPYPPPQAQYPPASTRASYK